MPRCSRYAASTRKPVISTCPTRIRSAGSCSGILRIDIHHQKKPLFNEIPKEERLDYSISYDFHLLSERQKRLINHQLTPLVLDKSGRIWLAVCVVSYSSQSKAGQIVVRKRKSNVYWEYSLTDHRWHKHERLQLSEEEKAILLLSAQGLKMEEIADRIFKSVDTVKFYKRRLFEKVGVKNITEALSFATNYRLI